MKNFLEKSLEKRGQKAEKDKTERVTRLGRRTREAIAKWNQMTALRFQTGGKTSDIPGLPSGGILKNFLRGKSQENVPLAGMGQDGVAGFGRTREKVSGIK